MPRLPAQRSMRRVASDMPAALRQRGFTLIEVMVVIFIIGIIVTFASLTITGRVLSDRLETEAQRLQQLFEMASEDAEMHGMEIGFVYTDRGYAFVATGPKGRWAPIPSGPLRPREVKDPIMISLKVEGRSVPPTPLAELIAAGKAAQAQADAAQAAPSATASDSGSPKDAGKDDDKDKDDKDTDALKPQALFLSSGETTALSIQVSAPGVETAYQLDVDNLGRGKLTTLDRSR